MDLFRFSCRSEEKLCDWRFNDVVVCSMVEYTIGIDMVEYRWWLVHFLNTMDLDCLGDEWTCPRKALTAERRIMAGTASSNIFCILTSKLGMVALLGWSIVWTIAIEWGPRSSVLLCNFFVVGRWRRVMFLAGFGVRFGALKYVVHDVRDYHTFRFFLCCIWWKLVGVEYYYY